jgi:hypothetical protein
MTQVDALTRLIILLCLTFIGITDTSSQSNGIYLQFNQDKFSDLHFFFEGENDTFDITSRLSEKVPSFKVGLNKSILKVGGLSLNADVGLRYFKREISKRHRFPSDNMLYDNIDVESIFFSYSVNIQYKLGRFFVSTGFENEASISRKLISNKDSYNFKGTDFADRFYKRMNSFYAKIGYRATKSIFVYLRGAFYTEYQRSYIPKPFFDRIIDQRQLSIGVQYDLWDKKEDTKR